MALTNSVRGRSIHMRGTDETLNSSNSYVTKGEKKRRDNPFAAVL